MTNDSSSGHSTVVVERVFDGPARRLFAAWTDAAQRSVWCAPGVGWELAHHHQDLRVGGVDAARFGPKGEPIYLSSGHFLNVVPDRRLVTVLTVHVREVPHTATLCTIDFLPAGDGRTRVIITDQSTYLDGPAAPSLRRASWEALMQRLEEHLALDMDVA